MPFRWADPRKAASRVVGAEIRQVGGTGEANGRKDRFGCNKECGDPGASRDRPDELDRSHADGGRGAGPTSAEGSCCGSSVPCPARASRSPRPRWRQRPRGYRPRSQRRRRDPRVNPTSAPKPAVVTRVVRYSPDESGLHVTARADVRSMPWRTATNEPRAGRPRRDASRPLWTDLVVARGLVREQG